MKFCKEFDFVIERRNMTYYFENMTSFGKIGRNFSNRQILILYRDVPYCVL